MRKKTILMILLLAFLNLVSCASGHQENALEKRVEIQLHVLNELINTL